MMLYTDLLTGDELFSDSFDFKEIEDGFFLEAEGKWIVVGDVEVNTGANASEEEADEGVDKTEKKVVDIVDGFRLQEQPGYDKKGFMGYIKPWLAKVLEKLPEGKKDEFKAKTQAGVKFLLSKIDDLQFFLGESMDIEGTLVYAYYKEGAVNPTFLFPAYAMKEVKC